MYFFCTYFDHHYLTRGLALYRSLIDHCPSFKLWVLCMDHICYDALSKLDLKGVHLISMEDFERGDEDLLSTKQNRSPVEYYFTCTPLLPLFIFSNFPEVDMITYLDADLFFFADPCPVYDEIAGNSIAIIGHRFPPNLQDFEKFGIYNVGWLSFRRDENAFTCLHWWRDRCIEWCYDRIEDGRFGDQKYLDDWPIRFQGVVVLNHKGANLAPWNISNYRIYKRRKQIWVDDYPLIFYHFHNFKKIEKWLYDPGLDIYKAKAFRLLRRGIYAPYIQTLLEVIPQISSLLSNTSFDNSLRYRMIKPVPVQNETMQPPLISALNRTRKLLHEWRDIFAQKYILVTNRYIP